MRAIQCLVQNLVLLAFQRHDDIYHSRNNYPMCHWENKNVLHFLQKQKKKKKRKKLDKIEKCEWYKINKFQLKEIVTRNERD